MRVLNVYSGNLYGGIETLLKTMARRESGCRGMEMHFALCFKGRLFDELTSAGATVHLLGNARASRPLTVLRARAALRKILLEEKYDLVICHAPWSQALFGAVVRARRIPQVFWLHDRADGRHWLERWARMTVPDLVLCNSLYTSAAVKSLYPNTPHKVFYCPVEAPEKMLADKERAAVRAALRTPVDATVIIQVSRMEAWKGHERLLDALALMDDCGESVCWIVGGAQRSAEIRYLEKLKSRAEALDVASRVRFLGERSDVAALLQAADIFCQPNLEPEPFGIVFIEALYAGLPVVATSMGGAAEIITNACGRLVATSSARELASTLRALIEEPQLRRSLSANGPRRARELCDAASQMAKLQSLLSGLVEKDFSDERIGLARMA